LLHLPDGMTKEEVQYCADAFLLKSRLSRYKGTITFQGSAKVKPNNLLTVKGLGKRFNGDAFISGVTHNMAEGQWLTTVRVGLDAL
ncbi:MAG: Rhs element Vgr protein, partial [Marinirhabdus sp.]|nr:Rhs element Vgr protein [Marinirhabdus sp.]